MIDTAHDGQELAPHLYLHNSHCLPDQSVQPVFLPLCSSSAPLERLSKLRSLAVPRHAMATNSVIQTNQIMPAVSAAPAGLQKTRPSETTKKTFMQVDQHTIPTQTSPPQQNKNKVKKKWLKQQKNEELLRQLPLTAALRHTHMM